jgi:hypothetical protein
MTSHEFDAHIDVQPVALEEPDYYEQMTVMEEFECSREATLKQQGAIDALQSLTATLSVLCLRDDVHGDYFFGLHDALEVTKSKLDIMKGGVL